MEELVNVANVLKEKNPKLYKYTPSCVLRGLAKLIHQDEINKVVAENSNDTPTEFAQHTLDYLQVKIGVHHEENFPKEGRYIVVANHPLGGLDGLALIALAGRYRTDVRFPVNDLLMHLTPLQEAFIPINKHGRNNHDFAQQLDAAFASDDLIFYFPAGLCSRKQKGEIKDLDWKKTIITKAKQHHRDIIPAFFDAKNSNRFYNLANIRKKLGFKFNIEMILLPDEMFRQKGNTFEVTFGKPISYQSFESSRTDLQWASWLKEEVYKLKKF